MPDAPAPGTLYLIPTPLGEGGLHALAPHALAQTQRLRVIVAEKGKTARAFLRQLEMPRPLAEMEFLELNKHTPDSALPSLLAPLLRGEDVGLMSEAGCPGVADPGARLVAAAHSAGLRVCPLVGPSSLLLALMASGMSGQQFAFHGYLPVPTAERQRALRRLEQQSRQWQQTQILIETPYRNNALLHDALKTLAPSTRLAVACELTLPGEWVRSLPVADWLRLPLPDLDKRPAVFLLYGG